LTKSYGKLPSRLDLEIGSNPFQATCNLAQVETAITKLFRRRSPLPMRRPPLFVYVFSLSQLMAPEREAPLGLGP
jgi:hypothetical protein